MQVKLTKKKKRILKMKMKMNNGFNVAVIIACAILFSCAAYGQADARDGSRSSLDVELMDNRTDSKVMHDTAITSNACTLDKLNEGSGGDNIRPRILGVQNMTPTEILENARIAVIVAVVNGEFHTCSSHEGHVSIEGYSLADGTKKQLKKSSEVYGAGSGMLVKRLSITRGLYGDAISDSVPVNGARPIESNPFLVSYVPIKYRSRLGTETSDYRTCLVPVVTPIDESSFVSMCPELHRKHNGIKEDVTTQGTTNNNHKGSSVGANLSESEMFDLSDNVIVLYSDGQASSLKGEGYYNILFDSSAYTGEQPYVEWEAYAEWLKIDGFDMDVITEVSGQIAGTDFDIKLEELSSPFPVIIFVSDGDVQIRQASPSSSERCRNMWSPWNMKDVETNC